MDLSLIDHSPIASLLECDAPTPDKLPVKSPVTFMTSSGSANSLSNSSVSL